MAKKTIVTIGRTSGSGGATIGKKLAEALGWDFYDKELLKEAAKESGLCESILESLDEKPKSLLYSLVMDPYSTHALISSPYNNLELNASSAIFDAIKKAAEKGPCVIVGRCADYALRDNEAVLNVFIHAPTEFCIERVQKKYGCSEEEARETIRKTNKQRSAYYNYYSSNKWAELASYHLCMDSSVLGLEGTVDFLVDFLSKT
ncbi:MAG: cytidylate kinase-like family protein [Clostridia bacterium]|nr:cytidylate kinase-like family protein [Clostridia bacterium]